MGHNINQPLVSVSIVSHDQQPLVQALIEDFDRFVPSGSVELLITDNLPHANSAFSASTHKLSIHVNAYPRGFGSNHNRAFAKASGQWFCVLNPDVRFVENPFPHLIRALQLMSAAAAGPTVVSPRGIPEDSIRPFPTPCMLLRKLVLGEDGRMPAFESLDPRPVDWVAGMFLLFRSKDFADVGMFDEKFHLYYEDVDICARLWKLGRPVIACPDVSVVHDARRSSRRQLRYMRWHAQSMLRYFWKHWLRLPKAADEASGGRQPE